jgi:hypothetical protein
MTVIAYRDGVMASDSHACWANGTKLLDDTKVARRRGHLFGLAGNDIPDLGMAVDWWLDGDGPYANWSVAGHEFALLVVDPRGRVELVDQARRFTTIVAPFFAIGSGALCALGAMHAGADARQAVAAAIQWVDGCGGRVMSRRL